LEVVRLITVLDGSLGKAYLDLLHCYPTSIFNGIYEGVGKIEFRKIKLLSCAYKTKFVVDINIFFNTRRMLRDVW
jgi:hypothetical protein